MKLRFKIRLSVLTVAMATFAAAIAPAKATPAIWEGSFGSALGLLDDSTSNTTFGSMLFPFAGTNYTGGSILSVSSNGFISLGGDNGNDCCQGNPSTLVNDTFARIAPLWLDINPNSFGDAYLNTFNDDADAAIDRIVVTWDSVLFDNNQPVTFQVQLFESGQIIMGYDGLNTTSPFNDDTLIGLSPGGGVADPGSTDLNFGNPFSTAAQSTIYQLFTGFPPPIDIDQSNLVFTPNAQGGWTVDTTTSVPEPGTLAIFGLGLAGLGLMRRRKRAG